MTNGSPNLRNSTASRGGLVTDDRATSATPANRPASYAQAQRNSAWAAPKQLEQQQHAAVQSTARGAQLPRDSKSPTIPAHWENPMSRTTSGPASTSANAADTTIEQAAESRSHHSTTQPLPIQAACPLSTTCAGSSGGLSWKEVVSSVPSAAQHGLCLSHIGQPMSAPDTQKLSLDMTSSRAWSPDGSDQHLTPHSTALARENLMMRSLEGRPRRCDAGDSDDDIEVEVSTVFSRLYKQASVPRRGTESANSVRRSTGTSKGAWR